MSLEGKVIDINQVSLYVIKELLGRQNLTTTQIYSHLNAQYLLEAVDLL